jgi:predicted amidohydrolase YtcJ
VTAHPLLLRDVDLDGRRADVRLAGAVVADVGVRLSPSVSDEIIDAAGGALLPGLHDHHIHLLALAAARSSLHLGPPEVADRGQMLTALREADADLPPGAWLRAVGYHDSIAGSLDRHDLDAAVPTRPIRVQHRSGSLWALNSVALARAGADGAVGPPGLERDARGRPTGRLFRLDDWLADRVPAIPLDLAAVGEQLASYGVTGVTDATPVERADGLAPLAAARGSGDLPQHVVVTGGPRLDPDVEASLPRGPVKLLLPDHDLPPLDAMVDWIRAARRRRRPVAVHCVTRTALVLAVTALGDTGTIDGDRIEHAAVVPVELLPTLRTLGLTVVTQPNLVTERGDRYLAEVDADDQPHLWRCGSLIAAGIPVGGSTDAPFGQANPWQAMSAATRRLTCDGRELGPRERISARQALDMFLTPLDQPGGPPRAMHVGAPADLCLLAEPLHQVLKDPAAAHVVATIVSGHRVDGH